MWRREKARGGKKVKKAVGRQSRKKKKERWRFG